MLCFPQRLRREAFVVPIAQTAKPLPIWLALAGVHREHLLGLEAEVLGVVPQEPLRVHGAWERLVIAALDRLKELLADPGVLGGLLHRHAFVLAPLAERVTEARHYGSSPPAACVRAA